MNEHLNTLRRLEDKPLLIESRWCIIGLHKWVKWKDPMKFEGKFIQSRFCIYCNKAQIRKAASAIDFI